MREIYPARRRRNLTVAAPGLDQHQLQASPDSVPLLDLLSSAYMQKVREVGDPSYYSKVEGLLTEL